MIHQTNMREFHSIVIAAECRVKCSTPITAWHPMEPDTIVTMISCILCGEKYKKGKLISFHRFPKDEQLRLKWLEACDLEEFEITDNSVLCSKHFVGENFESTSDYKKRQLSKNAVPSQMIPGQVKHAKRSLDFDDLPSTSSGAKKMQYTLEESLPDVDVVLEAIEQDSPGIKEVIPASPDVASITPVYVSPRYPGDTKPHHFATPRKAKRNLERLQTRIVLLQDKVKNLQRENRRKSGAIQNLKSLLEDLRSRNLISENAHQALMDTPEAIREILNRKILRSGKYSPALRSFAVTLHFYSPRAYEFVRKQMVKLLPHPRTIRKWYQVIDGEPGFTKESFQALEAHSRDAEVNQKGPVIVNLTIDEMSIREKIDWDGHKYVGLVDIGTRVSHSEEGAPKAKNALVFMAVALNYHWKVPLAYFLLDSLSGEERASLVEKCFHLLHESKVICLSITFDGAPSNLTMAKTLGASFDFEEDFRPWFPHPYPSFSEIVLVFLDPCHMLKLLRNALGQLGLLFDGNGQPILWEFIKKLVELQKNIGLRIANKLTQRHVDFQKNIMNVRLAAQTLSASVATALKYCEEEQNLPEFANVSGTSEFCLRVNNMFDILNCRNSYGRSEYGKPLSEKTIAGVETYIRECKEYLTKITDANGRKIINTNRKTGFLGFILSLDNIVKLYRTVRRFQMKYLLSYKISQDHIELFFSAIRSRGGFNNNPSAVQFKAAYKRLLVRHQISSNKFGNCAILDATTILHVSSSAIAHLPDSILSEDTEIMTSTDHDYVSTLWNLDAMTSDIVKYVAGFVIRKVAKSISCNACSSFLRDEQSFSLLEAKKTRGGLIKPALDVCKLCLTTEMCFRAHTNELFSKHNIKDIIALEVMSQSIDLFASPEVLEHIKSQDLQLNHRTQLMKLVINVYLDLRFFHETKREEKKKDIRHRYTKYILFANE